MKIKSGGFVVAPFRVRWFRRLKPAATCLCLLMIGTACTVKAVGDPNRPITINAHIIVDIREMKNTATNIEDMVEAGAINSAPTAGTQSGGKK